MQMAVDGKPQDKGKKTVVAGSKRSKRAAADRVITAAAGGGGGDGDDDDDDGDGYLPPKMTKRILEQAREQRDEMEEEEEEEAVAPGVAGGGGRGLAGDQVCSRDVVSADGFCGTQRDITRKWVNSVGCMYGQGSGSAIALNSGCGFHGTSVVCVIKPLGLRKWLVLRLVMVLVVCVVKALGSPPGSVVVDYSVRFFLSARLRLTRALAGLQTWFVFLLMYGVCDCWRFFEWLTILFFVSSRCAVS